MLTSVKALAQIPLIHSLRSGRRCRRKTAGMKDTCAGRSSWRAANHTLTYPIRHGARVPSVATNTQELLSYDT